MSPATGKIDIVGRNAEHTFMRYHQVTEKADIGKFMTFRADLVARWFNDYRQELRDFEPKKMWLF